MKLCPYSHSKKAGQRHITVDLVPVAPIVATAASGTAPPLDISGNGGVQVGKYKLRCTMCTEPYGT